MLRITKIITWFIGLSILASTSFIQANSITPDLKNLLFAKRSLGNVDVIIKLKNKMLISNTFSMERKEIIRTLKNKNFVEKKGLQSLLKLNHVKFKNLWLINSIAASVPTRLIPIIASRSEVSSIRIDKKITLDTAGEGNNPIQDDWNISAIGARNIWNTGVVGEGVVIGSMDTGVDINHPDLSVSWRGGNNSWLDPYGIYPLPYDSNGHGTQTTSLIVGGNASGHAIGVAPGAKWMAAKIFDDSDTASLSAIHQAFQWMLDPDGNPDTNDGANIINNSWNFGTVAGECNYEFQEDISILRSADVAVIFSAGNSGPSAETSHSPANNEDTIPVGAIDESGNIAFFSSRGPSACDDGSMYPKLTAPGVDVLTADLTFGGIIPNSYTYSSGTSYATPHVAGALALLQSKYPSSSLGDREEALYTTANIPTGSHEEGSRIIDVYAAIQYMGKIQLISPIGSLGAINNPMYTWDEVVDTTDYRLIVWDPADPFNRLVDTTYPVGGSDLTCSGAECTVMPASLLVDGSYRFRVRAKNAFGWGPWSNMLSFTVGVNSIPPATTTLVSPTGNVLTNTPNYTWNETENTTGYKLIVWDPTDSSNRLIDTTYAAVGDPDLVCNGIICEVTPLSTLVDGSYRYRVRTKNAFGWGAWSSIVSYTVGANSIPPNSTTLVSPVGNILTNTITYIWNETENTTDYRLIVWDPVDPANRLVDMTYPVDGLDLVCNGIICESTPLNTLVGGSYRFRVRTKNAFGWGEWSNMLSPFSM